MDEKNNGFEDQEAIEYTGEDTVDDVEIEDSEATQKDKLKKVKAELKTCKTEKAEILEELQRAKADFLNAKKRLEDQNALDRERTLDAFLASLLPLCDSFDMATADSDAWEAIDENWRKGVEGIKSQLDAVLKQHNVQAINAKDEHFDPNRHEAVSAIDDEGKSETIAEVLQKGYERNGAVIRPAKVIIRN